MRTKKTASVLRRIACGLFGLALVSVRTTAAESSSTAPQRQATIPQSVFVEDPRGKDPFFPNSTRRQFRPTQPVKKETGPGSLALLGISGTPERRIALINNQTFVLGEENRVRVPGGESMVKCIEIRANSVVVTIDGGQERYELQVRERTLPIAPEGVGPE